MVAKAVHLIEDTKLSLCILACCCVTIRYLILGTFFENLLQLSPVHQNRLDLLNLCASSVRVTNCQCSSEEETIMQTLSTYSAKIRFVHLSLSIRRSLSLPLFVRLSRSIKKLTKDLDNNGLNLRVIQEVKRVE